MTPTTTATSWRIWLQNHSLLAYFVLAFGISWLIEVPVALSQAGAGLLPYHLPQILTSTSPGVPLGPTGAAFLLTAILEGRPGVIRLLKRYIQWRVGLIWYLLILLGCPLLLMLTTSIFAVPHMQLLSSFLGAYFLHVLLAFFINGEEGGWRGFALPLLQQAIGPLRGSLLLGFLWGIWHLPLMLIPAQTPLGHSFTVALLVIFLLAIVVKLICSTWLFNNTSGSLLIATLFHAAASINGHDLEHLFGKLGVLVPELAAAIGFGATALLIIALTRGKLSYNPKETVLVGAMKRRSASEHVLSHG